MKGFRRVLALLALVVLAAAGGSWGWIDNSGADLVLHADAVQPDSGWGAD